MYRTPEGKEIFVVDGHTHFWDGSPENQKNIHGKQFIDCFYAYHTNLEPEGAALGEERSSRNTAPTTSITTCSSTGRTTSPSSSRPICRDFYKNGFNTIERNAEVAKRYPERFIVNGAFDPRDGEKALEYIHYMKETYDIKGVKLYTAEWNGASKGWRLNDPDAYRCFELCEKLGIKNIHVHKGPTIIPLEQGRLRRS